MTQPTMELDPASILPRLPMTKKVQAVVDDLLGDGFPVGLVSIPRYEKPGVTPVTWVNHEPPYAILYPLWSNLTGTWEHPDADAEWLYQVTLVAKRGDQLEWMRDRVVVGLLGRASNGKHMIDLDIEGMKVMYRDPRDDTGYSPDNAERTVGVLSSDFRFSLGVTRA